MLGRHRMHDSDETPGAYPRLKEVYSERGVWEIAEAREIGGRPPLRAFSSILDKSDREQPSGIVLKHQPCRAAAHSLNCPPVFLPA